MSRKGKEVAGKDSYGKRKLDDIDGNDKTNVGGGRKKRNPNVVQFFDDYAAEVDGDEESSDDSFFDDDDFFVDEFPELKVKSEPGKSHQFPFIPKEEEITEEELDKMLEERYKSGSGFVAYAEDNYDSKRTVLSDMIMPSAKEPIIWKVKCTVGREKHSAFCLMQKFVDLSSLGTKLQIISAFAVEHIKGSIYIEADKQSDVLEACKGLCSIYSSRVALVPINEISHLLSVRSKSNEVSAGMWARVKNGKYKGDLAQVVAVNDVRKKATVQLIPRIDLQALMEKIGGVTAKKSSRPTPRLISSFELEEFRPMIQCRRDRDTNKVCEFLDGLMLKDGFLFKKVSIDSLSFWGVMPTEEELEKFKSSEKDDSKDLEWLSQLYGEERKKTNLNTDKGGRGKAGKGGKGEKGEKGEGSSGSGMVNDFEVHDLVCFGKKDFGIIISVEKDDYYKIMKDSPAGPLLVTRESNDLKTALFDKKFTALDQQKKSLTIGDTVKVLDGALQGRQGIVKHIYRGTIFLYDENEEQNGGYFCSRSQMCEKVKLFDNSLSEKGGKSGNSGFEDFISSPKSPLSHQKPSQARETSESNRSDKEGMFSVGQSLRIRVGPLKGYLCRVLAIRRSDVTVKLDSKQKVLTVKIENLAEVRGKSSAFSQSGEPDSISIKPFEMLLNQGGSTDWMSGVVAAEGNGWNAGGAEGSGWNAGGSSAGAAEGSGWNVGGSSAVAAEGSGWNAGESSAGGAGGSGWNAVVGSSAGVAEGNGWNAGVSSAERSSWPSFPTSGTLAKDNCTTAFGSVDNDPKKVADAAWDTRVASTQSASWGAASTEKAPSNNAQAGGWGNQVENATTKSGFGNSAANSWDKAEVPGAKGSGDNWGKGKMEIVSPVDASDSWEKDKSSNEKVSWGKANDVTGNSTGSWNDVCKKNNSSTSGGSDWNKGKKCDNDGVDESAWGKVAEFPDAGTESQTKGWGNSSGSISQNEAGNTDQASGWKKDISNDGQAGNWGGKKDIGETVTGQSDKWDQPKSFGGSSWNKQGEPKSFSGTGGSSWNKQDGGSAWNKDGSDKQENWEKPRSYDEGFGSGGRRGRGRGGRDNFGGGRSFSRGQSDWNKQGQDSYQACRGTSMGNSSGWNSEQTGGWSKSKDFGGVKTNDWNKSNASGEGNVSNQNKGWGGGNEMGLNGNNWNSQASDGDRGVSGNQSSTWNTGHQDASKSSDASWSTDGKKGSADHRVVWNENKAPEETQKTSWGNKSNDQGGAGWKRGTSADGKDTSANDESGWDNKKGWNTPKGPQDTSSWNKKSSGDEKDAMNSRKTSEGVLALGWGQSSDWKTGPGDASKGSWNSGIASGGGKDKDDWNTAKLTGGTPASGGGWGGKFLGENQSSGWGRGTFSAEEDDDSTKSSNWSQGGDFGGRGGSDTGRGRFRGRGRSDRGGYGGRDYSDRGGYGGRGSSDRGGFRGRDGGGFRGRGRGRRDQNSDCNNNDSTHDKTFSSWSSGGGNTNGDEWKGNTGTSSWNQGEVGGKSWNSAIDSSKGSAASGSGWTSQGASWNQSTEGNKAGHSSTVQAGGWNKGAVSTNEAGGSKSGGWASGDNAQANYKGILETPKQAVATSSQAGGWNSQNSGWNKSSGTTEVVRSKPQTGGWGGNQAGDSNSQGTGWNQSSAGNEVAPSKPQTGGWGGNQAGASNSQGTGWNQSAGAIETGDSKHQAGGWG